MKPYLITAVLLIASTVSSAQLSIRETWTQFASALAAQDKEALEALSTSCIHCPGCLTNTDKEYVDVEQFKKQHAETWHDSIYDRGKFLPVTKFILEDIPVIMDSITSSRVQVDSLCFFSNNNHNAALFNKACIPRSNLEGRHDFQEVLVRVIDNNAEREGLTKGFAFIKTPQGYKFCGYSTVP